MISLQLRLNRGLALILCTVFIAQWLAADWVIRSVAEKQMLTRLEHDGDSLLESVQLNADGHLSFDPDQLGFVYRQAHSGHYYVLHADGGVYYSSSLQGMELHLPPLAIAVRQIIHFEGGPQGQPLLVLSRGIEKFGRPLSISIAEDLSDISHNIDSIRLGYLGLSMFVLLLAIGLQTSDVRRSLRPLQAMRKELADIANGRQQQITAIVPAEIRPLVKEVNRLLLLVERRLYQSRIAIGNLAHALKTPLAMLFRLAEHPALAQYPALHEQLQSQTEAMHRRIDKELKRARISGNARSGTSFAPGQEFTLLAGLLQNIYAEKELQIEVRSTVDVLRFDREDMLELAGNLLDNACKWARQRIVVTVERRQCLLISVEDDGPGCPEEDMRQLTQRGLRLDEAVQGHGLGLAIVRDIAEFYGGELHIRRSTDLGGLLVEVRFCK